MSVDQNLLKILITFNEKNRVYQRTICFETPQWLPWFESERRELVAGYWCHLKNSINKNETLISALQVIKLNPVGFFDKIIISKGDLRKPTFDIFR